MRKKTKKINIINWHGIYLCFTINSEFKGQLRISPIIDTWQQQLSLVNYHNERSFGLVSKSVRVRPSGTNKLCQYKMSLNQRAIRLCSAPLHTSLQDNAEKIIPVRSRPGSSHGQQKITAWVEGGTPRAGPIISNDNLIFTQVRSCSVNQRSPINGTPQIIISF